MGRMDRMDPPVSFRNDIDSPPDITVDPPAEDTKRLVVISLPYATFGLVVEDGQVVEAAPIAQWAVGKSVEYVIGYYWRKGAFIYGPAASG